MILPMKPRIRILNERKIHVCRKPGFIAWSLLSLSAIIFIEIFQQLTKNFLYLIVLLLGEIMFNLDIFGEWQDLLLDKDKNNAVIKKCTWIDKLCFKAAYDSCVTMKLSDIRYVGVSVDMGLFILYENGKTISLSMQGFTRQELQKLRKEINYFLNVNQIELLNSIDKIASNQSSLIASNTEYLHYKAARLIPIFISEEVPFLIDKLRNCKSYCLRNRSPTLAANRQKDDNNLTREKEHM